MAAKIIKAFSFLSALLLWQFASASHIAGGEIYYKHIVDSTYQITLKLYIDCENGRPDAIADDAGAYIAFYNASTNQLIDVDEVKRVGPNRVVETNYSCVTNTPKACVDEYTYQYNKVINPRNHGIVIAFQRCCRNNTISNLISPQTLGSTYTTTIPANSVVLNNSSPVYKKLPPNFLCVDAPLVFDHSAVDIDGDSLAYELVVPFSGATSGAPRPSTPKAPPYARCMLKSPYTLQDMMGGSITLKINAKTGELRVTPDKVGQFVVGILVKEYRKGVLISEVLRDYQFNVFNCDLATQANFISASRICNDTARFTDLSKSALSYHWDFGEVSKTNDTSDKAQPKWYYQQAGDYRVQLIVSNGSCMDTFFNYIEVVTADSIHALIKADPDSACGSLTVNILNNSDKTPYWEWNMGDGSPLKIKQNPSQYYYNTPGVYNISLKIVDSTKCNISDIQSVPIHVFTKPLADFELAETLCDGEVKFRNKSVDATTYNWTFLSSTIPNSSNADPTIIFDKGGFYNIKLVASNNLCSDSAEKRIAIEIIPTLDANLKASPLKGCAPLTVYFNPMKTGNSKHYWDMGDGNIFTDSFFTSYTYNKEGTFNLKYVILDSTSCNIADSSSVVIRTKDLPIASFSYDFDPCSGDFKTNNYSENAKKYQWDFGNGIRSNEKEPSFKAQKAERIQISLQVDSGSICPATYVLSADLSLSDLSQLFIPNIFTPGVDGINDCFSVAGVDPDCYNYEMKVYNRWGELVFENFDLKDCWTGSSRYSHVEFPNGVYFATYKFLNKTTGVETILSNTVTLVR